MRRACPSTRREPVAAPGTRRIYSNTGIEIAAERVGDGGRHAVRRVLRVGLGLPARRLAGARRRAAADDARSRWRASSCGRTGSPVRPSPRRSRVQFPGLNGRHPGNRTLRPVRLGSRARAHRTASRAHWTGTKTSAATFGHFGGGGGFLWVDPDAGIALTALSDLEFGDWALEAWPRLADCRSRRGLGPPRAVPWGAPREPAPAARRSRTAPSAESRRRRSAARAPAPGRRSP